MNSEATRDRSEAETQRLDKWLWFTRLVKSRTLAAALVSEGRVRLNRQRVDKPSQTVRVGDVVTAMVHRQLHVVRVLAPGERRGPAGEARLLYEVLAEGGAGGAGATPSGGAEAKPGHATAGPDGPRRRPGKHERRELLALKRGDG